KPVYTFKGAPGQVTGVAFSPDGDLLAACSAVADKEDGGARLWDLKAGQDVSGVLVKEHRKVACLAFTTDRQDRALGGPDGRLRLWDLTEGKEKETLAVAAHSTAVQALVRSPDGTRLATCCPDRTIRIWDAVTAEELLPRAGFGGGVLGLAVSP